MVYLPCSRYSFLSFVDLKCKRTFDVFAFSFRYRTCRFFTAMCIIKYKFYSNEHMVEINHEYAQKTQYRDEQRCSYFAIPIKQVSSCRDRRLRWHKPGKVTWQRKECIIVNRLSYFCMHDTGRFNQ